MSTIATMPWNMYGNMPRDLPRGVDFVNVINEDLGFNSLLDTGVNDLFESSIPYPAEWDQDTEVVMMHRMKGWFQDRGFDNFGYAVSCNLSYLDRRPEATFRGQLTDTNEEWMKSVFAPDMKAGRLDFPTSTGFLGGAFSNLTGYGWDYSPEVRGGLSMFFPIYLDLSNQTVAVTVATGDAVAADLAVSVIERFVIQYFYTVRRMTRAERDFMASLSGVPMRWSQLAN